MINWPRLINTYEVVKKQKRLWIQEVETGRLVYTPPDFMRLPSRQPLIDLALEFNKAGERSTKAIIAFESNKKFHP